MNMTKKRTKGVQPKTAYKKILLDKYLMTRLILIVVLFSSVIYYGTLRMGTDNKLKSEGICINGLVNGVQHVGAKGDVATSYQFEVKGKIYEADSYYDDDLKVGDSIVIVYLESDPTINRSNNYLHIDCSNRFK